MHMHFRSKLSKVRALKTDRHTDIATEDISTTFLQVAINQLLPFLVNKRCTGWLKKVSC